MLHLMIAGSWRSCIKAGIRPWQKKTARKYMCVCGSADPQKVHEDGVQVLQFFAPQQNWLKHNQHRPLLSPRDWSETGWSGNDCHQAQDNLLLRLRVNNKSYKQIYKKGTAVTCCRLPLRANGALTCSHKQINVIQNVFFLDMKNQLINQISAA